MKPIPDLRLVFGAGFVFGLVVGLGCGLILL